MNTGCNFQSRVSIQQRSSNRLQSRQDLVKSGPSPRAAACCHANHFCPPYLSQNNKLRYGCDQTTTKAIEDICVHMETPKACYRTAPMSSWRGFHMEIHGKWPRKCRCLCLFLTENPVDSTLYKYTSVISNDYILIDITYTIQKYTVLYYQQK